MKNYLLVNRALVAEKNINYLNNLFSRVKEHSSPTVNRRSTDGQSQRQYTIGLMKYAAIITPAIRYVATLLVVLMVGFGQMWGTSVTFSAADIAGREKKGIIQANCSTSTAEKQLWNDGSSHKYYCIPISSSMGTSDTQTNPISTKNILFTADSGYKITGISIVGASNSSSAAKEVVICWTGDISNTPASFQQIDLVGYAESSMPTAVSVSSIPDGTKSFGLYIKVKVDDATTPTSLYTGSGCKDYGAGNSQNVYSVTVTYEAVASKDYTVTAESNNDSYGTVAAEASSLDEGETTTITATPADGYRVSNWAVDGTGASISPSGDSHSTTTTLTMGTANATVTCTFEAIPTYTISYDKGANGTGTISSGTKYDGVAFTLSTEHFTRAGYAQTGWSLTDGGAKAYSLGGSYTTDAAQTFYPYWEATTSYTFDCEDEKSISTLEGEGWIFNSKTFDADPTDGEAYANLVSAMNSAGLTTPKTKGMPDYAIAIAKSGSAYAEYVFSEPTTVSGLTATIAVGSGNARTIDIIYLSNSGSELKKISTAHSETDWGDNSISNTSVVENVKRIRIKCAYNGGSRSWTIIKTLGITYVSAGCTAPTGLTNGTTTAYRQDVSWTAGGSESAWEVYVSTSSSTPAADAMPTATPTSAAYTFRSLDAGTTYYWWVRAKCDVDDYSDWVAGTSFTTSSSARTFKSGEIVYFKDEWKDKGNDSNWKIDGKELCAYFWNDTEGAWKKCIATESGSWNTKNTIYKIIVPGSGKVYDHVLFSRGGDKQSNVFATIDNQTSNQSPSVGYNIFYVNNTKDGSNNYGGTWGRYAHDPALIGDFNDWDPDANVFTDFSSSVGDAYFTLAEEETYGFKVLEGATYYSYDNSKAGWTLTNTNTTTQQFYNNNNNSNITSTEAGEYMMKYNKSTHSFVAVYYPKERLARGTIVYFDARNETNWKSDNFDARYGWQYFDSGSEQSWTIKAKGTALENWVYYAVVPNNKTIGRIEMKRLNPADNNTVWCTANAALASSRTSVLQNCLKEEKDKEDYCNSWTPQWTTYCPPTDVVTLSDNSTTVITGTSGNGSKANPYLVVTGGTINVTASADQLVNDDNMTQKFDFEVNKSSKQDGTGSTYSHSASTNNTVYKVTVKSYNYYNSTSGTKVTSDTLYYKALNTYNITYYKGTNGTGTEYTDLKIYGIDKSLRGAIFTRNYYTQTGWAIEDGGSKVHNLSADYTGNTDLELYPVWTPNQYSVTHTLTDSHVTCTSGATGANAATHATDYTAVFARTTGYNLPSTITVTIGGNSTTSGTEYTWNQGTGTVTIDGSYITGNIVITVTGTLASHTLDWSWNGGSTSATAVTNYTAGGSVNYGASLTYPANNTMSKTGYTFTGWSSSPSTMPDEDLTITAQWTANTYTVTLSPDNGADAVAVTATYAAAMPSKLSDGKTSVAVPTFTNYVFGGYFDDHCGAGTQYYDEDVASANTWDKTSNTTLYALWTQSISLDSEGGSSGSSSVTATYKSATLPSITNPTKTGYTFGGWYDGDNGTGNLVINTGGVLQASVSGYTGDGGIWTSSSTRTLHAKWTAKTYSITLDDNGGSADGGATATYNSTSLSSISEPTYSGHEVDGYYTSANCTTKVATDAGALQASITVDATAWTNSSSEWKKDGTATFYAHWKCNTPTITDNGDNTVSITVPDGTTVYYTTDESAPSSSNGTEYTDAFDIAEDVTVKAIAIQDDCTDSEVASVDCKYSAPAVGECDTIARVKVTGASKGTAAGTKIGSATVSLEDNTQAYNDSTGYKLGSSKYVALTLTSGEYFQNGDSVIVYLTKLTDLSSKDNKLHIYAGTSTAGTEVVALSSPILGWNRAVLSNVPNNTPSITIHRGSGTSEQNHYVYAFIVKRCAAACDGTPSAPTATSNGATTDNSQAVSWTDASNEKWDVIYSTSSTTPDAGDTPTASDLRSKSYTFTGLTASTTYYWWVRSVCDASHKSAWTAGTNFTTAAVYTVTYNANGGSCETSSETDASVTLPDATHDSGYDLEGWYTTAGTKVGAAGATYNPTADITLYARWQAACTAGSSAGTTLFTQNFGSATAVAYAANTAHAYTTSSTLSGLVGSGDNLFTSITNNAKTTAGIAINSSTGGNSADASGIFQAYYDNNGYWSITRTTDFAATAPTAIKVSMDIWADQLSSASGTMVNFAVGDDFTDGLTDKAQATKNVHSGWGLTNESSVKICQYDTYGTKLYSTALTEKTWYSFVWIINNTGSTLTYADPDGSGTSTVNNDCFDLWMKTQAGATSTFARVVAGQAATTATKDLQHIHIGNNGAKKHEFRLDNLSVVDLTPSGGTCYNVIYNGNGATSGYTNDPISYESGATATAATNGFTRTGYSFDGWATSEGGTKVYDEGDDISISTSDVTLYARWASASYTLTWNTNGGSALSCTGTCTSGDLADGTTIVAPSDPTLSNYTFVDWNTKADGTGSDVAATMPAEDVTYYAVWKNTLTLKTGDKGSGNDETPTVYKGGSVLNDFTAHTAAGYRLLGYYAKDDTKVLNADGSFAASNVARFITSGKWSRTTGDTTLVAKWEQIAIITNTLGVGSNKWSSSISTGVPARISSLNALAAVGTLTIEDAKGTTASSTPLTCKIEASGATSKTNDEYLQLSFTIATGYQLRVTGLGITVRSVAKNGKYHVELAGTTGSLTPYDEQVNEGVVAAIFDDTYDAVLTGTVTMKLWAYGADGSNLMENYRLGSPVTIYGQIEEACTMPSYSGLDYEETEYVKDPSASASAISVTGESNVTTYTWMQNTTNDRSGGSAVSTGSGYTTASFTPNIESIGTTYYWCELSNDCGTVKTPAVGITVVSGDLDDVTVTWTDPASEVHYGGGGYTIRATVDQTGWDGTLSASCLTAPAGIRIYNVTTGTADGKQYIEAKFDVQTAFDNTNATISFTLTHDATEKYVAISDEHEVDYDACADGEDEAVEYLMPVDAAHIDNDTWKGGWVYEGIGRMRYGHGSSNISAGTKDANLKDLSYTMASGNITKYYKSASTYFGFYTEKAITGIRLYVYTSNDNVTVSNVYVANSAYTSGTPSSGAVGFEAEYNDENDALRTGTHSGSAWVDITFDKEVAAGKYGQINLSNNVYIAGMAFICGNSTGASLTTTLTFADAGPVAKTQSSANFTNAATVGSYSETLGAITYSSSNTSCATVNATTGEVTITASGTSDLSTTITATLAASGCYKGATATYVINVPGVECTVNHGTLSSNVTSKCSSADATLTLTGFESGATVQWYKGEDAISNEAPYAITTVGTTSTLVTAVAGMYSVMVTKDECSDRSNSITISNYSAEVAATKIVDKWYIKHGRVTPDIALWALDEGTHLDSVTWSTTNATGLTIADFYESDGVVYMSGKEPNTNESSDVEYTLTLRVKDECENKTLLNTSAKQITLIHQKNTDKHVLAFVVTGTEKGGWTAGISADQTTNVELYNEIAKNFDVLATNIYSTDDEQKLKEYYSQFDILCITDYPNTKTKGVNSKSYVDAMGALIDIRPILTMEAWVSGLSNWKSKGISGTPHSPSTRQYSMLLQCKDHEIFSGTTLTTVGEGDETMYRVSMVDKTLANYPTLDGYTPGSKDYDAGGKPALQGFEYTSSMSDLLPLGLIDDGSGNDLQVGLERQHEMEARMMVLGVNSYAMERLSDDGETIIINALKYLMKKNAEDISDCSNSFIGGADGEGQSTNWANTANWSGNTLPDRTQKVRILAPCVIKNGTSPVPHVAEITIVPSGNYHHGDDEANGSLTIEPNASLIVDGKIYAATAPNYYEKRTTEPEDLVVEADASHTGTLIFDNKDGETQATVEMYSKSFWEYNESTRKYVKYWSYVGMPIKDVHIPEYFYGAFTYYYNEAKGWEKRYDDDIMQPFEGIGLAMQDGHKETFRGTMVSTENIDMPLSNTENYGEGDNLISNSWTAPIQIANFDAEDFGTAWASVYIFNTGKRGRTYVNATADNDGASTAGQWLGIPIGVAGLPDYTGLKVIPAMQGFLVHNDESATTTIHLDYDKLVREDIDTLVKYDQINEPMRSPKQARPKKKKDVDGLLRIRVVGETTYTDVWMMQDARFSEAYDNGWDTYFSPGDNRSPKLYARSAAGNMAFLALPDLDGTVLGFAPSRDGNDYSFTFRYRGEDEYYLNDLKLQQSVLIDGENTYSFTYEAGDANRFYISRTPLQAPQNPTGVDNTENSASQSTKAIKVIYNDKLYIIRGGRVYGADGSLVK